MGNLYFLLEHLKIILLHMKYFVTVLPSAEIWDLPVAGHKE